MQGLQSLINHKGLGVPMRSGVSVTVQFTPDADPESISIDGDASRGSVDETLAVIRAGAGTAAFDNLNPVYLSLRASTTTDQFQQLHRVFLLFDTSSIPDNATVVSAILTARVFDISRGLGDVDIHLVASTPASNTAIIAADYAQVGNTSFGSVNTAGVVSDQDLIFTLNANGLAAISKNGVTKLALRTAWDLNNSFTGSWVNFDLTRIRFYSADGGSHIPTLAVTYTV